MKIEQIKQVIEVYSAGSINKAAQNLFMAQSSLSSSIKVLERELGQQIFTRTQSGISLTAFGREFIVHGREIIKHVEQIESFTPASTVPAPQFRLAAYFLLFASNLFFELCNRYADERCSFSYMEDTRSAIIDLVAAGSAEIGLLTMPVLRKPKWMALMSECGLTYSALCTEQPCAIVGPQSRLFRSGEGVRAEELRDQPFIIFPESHPLLSSINRDINRSFHPSSFISVSDRGTLTSVLYQTTGVYLGTWNAGAYRNGGFYENVDHIPLIDADFSIEIGYIQRRDQQLTAMAREYLQNIHLLLTE